MKKKTKSDKKVKVTDLSAKNSDAKGGTYTTVGTTVMGDGSVKYLSNTSTTDLKANKN